MYLIYQFIFLQLLSTTCIYHEIFYCQGVSILYLGFSTWICFLDFFYLDLLWK